jgi:hypothetical protein
MQSFEVGDLQCAPLIIKLPDAAGIALKGFKSGASHHILFNIEKILDVDLVCQLTFLLHNDSLEPRYVGIPLLDLPN